MRKRISELRVRIDEGIHEALKRIAREEGRSISELVREAIADLLLKRDRKREGIDETVGSDSQGISD